VTELKPRTGDDEGRKPRLETITLPRPRCPRCGGIRLMKYRSIRDQGDGTSLSWMRCEDAPLI